MLYQRERLTQVIDEALPLIAAHHYEIRTYQDLSLRPDFDAYNRLEDIGMLRTFTARNEDGKLLGYAVFFVRNSLHFKDSTQAVVDMIYIDPKVRGLGFGFIRWCDEQLRLEKVQVVYHHSCAIKDYAPILRRLGYDLIEYTYAKRLD